MERLMKLFHISFATMSNIELVNGQYVYMGSWSEKMGWEEAYLEPNPELFVKVQPIIGRLWWLPNLTWWTL